MMVRGGKAVERTEVGGAVTDVPTSSLQPVIGAPSSSRVGHRRHPRARGGALFARLRVGDGVVVANVEDISVGGFFSRTTHAVPVGAFVELTLLRPGREEIQLGGVVVDDAARRQGLALRFEAMSPTSSSKVRQLVEELQDAQEGRNPDRGVTRTRPMADEAPRDAELSALRQKVALLTAENNRLRAEVEAGAEAEKLVGRLRLEVERLKARIVDDVAVDPAVLSDIKRDAEVAWTAIARLSDAVDRLR